MRNKRSPISKAERLRIEAGKAQDRRRISRVRMIDLEGDVPGQLLELMKLLAYVCEADHESGEKKLVVYVRVED